MKININYSFHLVTFSPWPILGSFRTFVFIVGRVIIFSEKETYLINWGVILLLLCRGQWWRDVVREGTFQGRHTKIVVRGLKLGIILFIVSELIFFVSFFWTFFHSSLSPNIEIGREWPPQNIEQFNPYQLPLFNTVILLSSGVTITWRHYSILNKNWGRAKFRLLITIYLGMLFTCIQMFEYNEASFIFRDSIFGSIFFLTTGFHGIHVVVGSIFLLVTCLRLRKFHFSSFHHFGFEGASWYWHFVDVIWIIVYSIVYWWHY